MSLACHRHVLVENSISTRSAHFSTVFFHTCLKLRNRQSGQAVFAWRRDFHTLFHTLWKTGFCGFVAGCRTGVGYDIFCDFCIIGVVCLLGYLVNRVGLWGAGGWSPADLALPEPGGGRRGAVACRPCLAGTRRRAQGGGRPLPLPLACFSAPIPPTPFPAGRGGLIVFLCKGLRPLHPRGCTHGSPRKRQEAVPYEQCRQPRRGGTGGEELRRLRWSSPPGQGEPVPSGFSPPPGTANARRAGEGWGKPPAGTAAAG